MSGETTTFRVHRLLAASHPEPIERGDLARRLGVPAKRLDHVLQHGIRLQIIRRARPLTSARGYAYTVAA